MRHADTFHAGLTPAETERLALLAEECGEVIQAVSKVLRHGYESHNPTSASLSPSNRETLETEIGHVQHAIERLAGVGDLSFAAIAGARKRKAETVWRWLHHQGGVVETADQAEADAIARLARADQADAGDPGAECQVLDLSTLEARRDALADRIAREAAEMPVDGRKA